jgi:hypothetical protein
MFDRYLRSPCTRLARYSSLGGATTRCPPMRRVRLTSGIPVVAHRHRPVVDEWALRRLDACGSQTGQRPLLHIVRTVRSGAVHCVIGISSSARDQPGRGAPLPQLPGQVVGASWTDSGVLPPSSPVGRRVDDTSRVAACKENTRPAGMVLPRATWAPMLNPRTLRSVPGIWGHVA